MEYRKPGKRMLSGRKRRRWNMNVALPPKRLDAQNTAFLTKHDDPPVKLSNPKKKLGKQRECSYCKKHFPSNACGHSWMFCRRMKIAKSNNRLSKKNGEVNEVANMTTLKRTISIPRLTERGCNFELWTRNDRQWYRHHSAKMFVVKGSVIDFKNFDVLYVPHLLCSLLSWIKLRSEGYHLYDNGVVMRLFKGNETFIEAKIIGKLPVVTECDQLTIHNAFMTYEFWHQALYHAAPASIAKTGKLIQDSKIFPDCPYDFHCETCALAKSHHSTPKPSSSRARERGEYIHSDLCGPHPIPSLSNSLYYISFVDDATRYSNVQFLKRKSDAVSAIVGFITELETQYGCRTKTFRSDNGGEYVNNELYTFFAQKGIIHDLTPPYSPESNGVAERLNRSIGEAIRAMPLPFNEKFLWAEAANTYIYTKNRLAHGAVNGKTPYEAFYGKKPSILNFQPFGRECYVHIPVSKRPSASKLLQRAEKASKLNADRTPPSSLPQPERVQEIPPVTVTLSTLKNGSGKNYYLSNLPREQGSSNASEMSSHQQLHETVPSTAEMLANHSEQAEITQSTSPGRSVRPRVIENITTGDWWKEINPEALPNFKNRKGNEEFYTEESNYPQAQIQTQPSVNKLKSMNGLDEPQYGNDGNILMNSGENRSMRSNANSSDLLKTITTTVIAAISSISPNSSNSKEKFKRGYDDPRPRPPWIPCEARSERKLNVNYDCYAQKPSHSFCKCKNRDFGQTLRQSVNRALAKSGHKELNSDSGEE
ncbi:hypothetical protein K3495_g8668 [Podosphaera aphanis]|nr:hypothetical protein K3495_g8668 [Podosphaera aphanis]